MYGLCSVARLQLISERKCTSASGTCFFTQRNTGLASTISPIEEKRMMSNFFDTV
jgi:hypothetical protein